MNDSITAWNKYATEYNSKSAFSSKLVHVGLALPGISADKIVKTSKSVLDVGCGNGINTFLMSQAADIITLGVDPVKEQIDDANNHFAHNNLSFACSDFNGISSLNTLEFDLVTFFGSIDYIPLDEQFFRELNILTHYGSRCYITKFHPIWTTLYANDIDKEIDNNSYFDVGRIDVVQFGNSRFNRYHYGIGEIIAAFSNAGWNITTISEPRPDFGISAFAYEGYDGDPVLGKRLERYPMTIIFEFKRG